MSLTWLPGAYGQRDAAHNRLRSMEAKMKIRPEEQKLFDKQAKREDVRRQLRVRMERLANAIDEEKKATLLTTQKISKLSAIKRTKRRERKLRKTIEKQLRIRPTTSSSTRFLRTTESRRNLSRQSNTTRLTTSRSTNGFLDSPSSGVSSAVSSGLARSSSRAESKRPSTSMTHRRSRNGIDDSEANRNDGRPSTRASSIVSEKWLKEDPQAPFSARRHTFKAVGMNYVPMDFAGHEDRLRTYDGPARVARYFGRRRQDFESKLLQARRQKVPAFGRKQTDISRVPEKQALCSSLKYMDGPAAGDTIRTVLPASDVTTFVNFINNPTPFLRPMGEKHHLSLTNLVKEREILHENLGAMGESSIQQNNGLYGTWY